MHLQEGQVFSDLQAPATHQFSFFFIIFFMYLFTFPSSMNVWQVFVVLSIVVLSPTLTHGAKDPSLIDVFAFIDTYQFNTSKVSLEILAKSPHSIF